MSNRRSKFRMMPDRRPTDFNRLPSLALLSPDVLNSPSDLFLKLCAWTVPHGGEDAFYGKMLKAAGFSRDKAGNYTLQIDNAGSPSDVCFMAHLDTAGGSVSSINRVIEGGVCRTDGKTILGADDRAGVTVLLYLASRDVPGYYCLFAGEEAGCIGSEAMSKSGDLPEHITKAISFDRKGSHSVITHQCMSRTCSDEFAASLCHQLNALGLEFEPDSGGLYTDSREFAAQVSECTNISVGYEGQHTTKEKQDLDFLDALCRSCEQVAWEALPAVRIPAEEDYSDLAGYDDNYYGAYDRDWWDKDRKGEAYGSTSEDRAYEAIENLSESFACGLPVDRSQVWLLMQSKTKDTVDMIEMLIDEMQRAVQDKEWQ